MSLTWTYWYYGNTVPSRSLTEYVPSSLRNFATRKKGSRPLIFMEPLVFLNLCFWRSHAELKYWTTNPATSEHPQIKGWICDFAFANRNYIFVRYLYHLKGIEIPPLELSKASYKSLEARPLNPKDGKSHTCLHCSPVFHRNIQTIGVCKAIISFGNLVNLIGKYLKT